MADSAGDEREGSSTHELLRDAIRGVPVGRRAGFAAVVVITLARLVRRPALRWSERPAHALPYGDPSRVAVLWSAGRASTRRASRMTRVRGLEGRDPGRHGRRALL
ncbi:MAG: hypothetical protein U0163_05055 [Gemmatimonadaceae bacterium]